MKRNHVQVYFVSRISSAPFAGRLKPKTTEHDLKKLSMLTQETVINIQSHEQDR